MGYILIQLSANMLTPHGFKQQLGKFARKYFFQTSVYALTLYLSNVSFLLWYYMRITNDSTIHIICFTVKNSFKYQGKDPIVCNLYESGNFEYVWISSLQSPSWVFVLFVTFLQTSFFSLRDLIESKSRYLTNSMDYLCLLSWLSWLLCEVVLLFLLVLSFVLCFDFDEYRINK